MMKLMTKTTCATLIAGAMLFGGSASAATKEESKWTTQYSNLKTGMTLSETAKVLYGKEYKKQLIQKSGSTILKKKADDSYSEQGQKSKVYVFANGKNQNIYTSLLFMTKKNSSVYRLIGKSLDVSRESSATGARESTRKLAKGATIKVGMTEKQLDTILSGTGLGEWTGLDSSDWTSVQSKSELALIGPVKSSLKIYVFPTTTSKRKLVVMDYDYKKKTYRVGDQSSL